MKVLVVGGTGTIGQAVVDALSGEHRVIVAGHTTGEVQVDLADPTSIERLYDTVGPLDAVVSCAGEAAFGALGELDDADFDESLSNKLMGQVNLVRRGLGAVRDEGSMTLTSGVLSQEPMEGSAAISLVNAGLEGFVRAAALEMPRGLRVNVVSPPWVSETLEAMGQDPAGGLPAADVARAYVASLEGEQTGAVIDARDYASA
jgi:NAD(P)-dependent dehydrogenase (short-subunit alcohol dehydrogenase family)